LSNLDIQPKLINYALVYKISLQDIMLGGLKNAGSAMANFAKLKAQQDKLQKLLSSIRVTGTSKNNKVTVVITGEQKIVEINIDPALIKFVHDNFIVNNKPDTMMSKAIIEAVEDAVSKVQTEVVKQLQANGGIDDLMGMLQAAGTMGGVPGQV
jgi:DNA-binding protein YbaB